MPENADIGGVKVPVPSLDEIETSDTRLRGSKTGLGLSRFVFDLFELNESRFHKFLEESHHYLTVHEVSEGNYVFHPSLLPPVRKKTSKPKTLPLPYSDPQLEGAIRTEFAEYPTVIEAFDQGTYRISEFRSKYRRRELIKGSQPKYASFAYELGFPCSRRGGHSQPLTREEFIEYLKVEANFDPRFSLSF